MRETEDVARGAIRMVRAVGSRVGQEDPDGLEYLNIVRDALDSAMRVAVEGLREGGHTDKAIGEALGMTRQAVQQRWPRATRAVGAGARYRAR